MTKLPSTEVNASAKSPLHGGEDSVREPDSVAPPSGLSVATKTLGECVGQFGVTKRNWGATVFFMSTACSCSLTVDCFAWQWWRQPSCDIMCYQLSNTLGLGLIVTYLSPSP